MSRERNKKIIGPKETLSAEVFYSLSSEDILRQADIMKIARNRLTPEVMEKIKQEVKGEISEFANDALQEAVSDIVHEKEAEVRD